MCESLVCGAYGALVFVFTSADVILLVLSTLFCILSSVAMEQSVFYSWYTTDNLSYNSFFTIGTFFATFSKHDNLVSLVTIIQCVAYFVLVSLFVHTQ